MVTGANIFNYLDEERKIMGFSILEISVTSITCLLGFILNAVLLAVVGMFSSVFIIRYIKGIVKKSGFKRKMFFKASDVLWRKKVKYYGKYYL